MIFFFFGSLCLFLSTCLVLHLLYNLCFLCFRRGEDGEKEEKAKDDKGKQKLRQLHAHRYGEPEVPESAFWKKIIAYQQKLLVRLPRMAVVLIDCPWLMCSS